MTMLDGVKVIILFLTYYATIELNGVETFLFLLFAL